jgi:hypothetical protein
MIVKFSKNLPFGWDRVNMINTLYVSDKVRSKWFSNNDYRVSVKTYEGIRSEQMKELLIIFYWVINLVEWITRLILVLDRTTSLDKECQENKYNPRYLLKRKRYSWIKYYK